jgi:hypothetical protein
MNDKEPKVTKCPNFGLSECKMVGCPVHDKQASEGKCSGDCVRLAIECPLHNRKIEPSRETAGWKKRFGKKYEMEMSDGAFHLLKNFIGKEILAAEKRGEEKAGIEDRDVYSRAIKIARESAKAETEKAFGGCKNCYGKGYATVRYGYEGYDDFAHEGYVDPIKTNIHPCKCSRGEEIEKILSSAKAEGYKEGVQDGEGTKNGVKRYRMGFDAGKAEGGKEMLTKAVEEMRLAQTKISGGGNGRRVIEQLIGNIKSLSENKPK